jgi:hypothetical protein
VKIHAEKLIPNKAARPGIGVRLSGDKEYLRLHVEQMAMAMTIGMRVPRRRPAAAFLRAQSCWLIDAAMREMSCLRVIDGCRG